MSSPPRRDTRYRVHLSVRYGQAIDFVQEYAENLSKGGLFIRGATELNARDRVMVEISLPGYGSFKVEAEVAHVLSEQVAQTVGRKPGAGMAVTRAPGNYTKALRAYLRLLGRRRDCVVYADTPEGLELLEAAGYGAMELPPVDRLTEVLRYAPKPVLGIVLTSGDGSDYAAPAFAANMSDRLYVITFLEELETLLPKLDEHIPQE